MTTRLFSAEELNELGVEPWGEPVVASWVVDERRWSIVKACVFEHEGAFWCVEYHDPATEMQEGQDPWNDESDVLATQVHKVPVTIERWLPMEDA